MFVSLISLLILFACFIVLIGELLYLAVSIEYINRIHTELIKVLAVAKLSYRTTCCALSGNCVRWSILSVLRVLV